MLARSARPVSVSVSVLASTSDGASPAAVRAAVSAPRAAGALGAATLLAGAAFLAGLACLSGCRERVLAADAASEGSGARPPPTSPSSATSGTTSGTTSGNPPGTAPASIAPREPQLSYPGGGSFVDVVGASRMAVVALRAKAPVKSGPAAMLPGTPDAVADVALGTGFLVEAKGPHVLTTDRIAVAAAELSAVQVDGTELPLRLVGRDPRLDIALFAVGEAATATGGAAPLRLPALTLGDSDRLLVGEWVLVLGNPFGDEVTASAGIVSATGRDATAAVIAPSSGAIYRTMLQTDARIHRGNSGGPVLDTAGQVIGIATATSDRPTELSFVIPINRVREIIDTLRDSGKVARAWLGAMVNPVTAQRATSLGMPKATGALVTQLMPSSPAARSSLKVGDVVMRWNDRDVDHRSLPWLVAGTPAGKPVRVVVWRSGASLELSVTVEPMPQ